MQMSVREVSNDDQHRKLGSKSVKDNMIDITYDDE